MTILGDEAESNFFLNVTQDKSPTKVDIYDNDFLLASRNSNMIKEKTENAVTGQEILNLNHDFHTKVALIRKHLGIK